MLGVLEEKASGMKGLMLTRKMRSRKIQMRPGAIGKWESTMEVGTMREARNE